MNQEHLNRLDFTNEALNKWLDDCPFDIWHFRQNWDKKEYTKEDPMGLKGTERVYKAVDVSVAIPVEICPINLKHYFKDNDALAKLQKDYTETHKLMQAAMNTWTHQEDPIASREAKKSFKKYREQLRYLEKQLEKAEGRND